MGSSIINKGQEVLLHDIHYEILGIKKPITHSQNKNKHWTICCFSAQLH